MGRKLLLGPKNVIEETALAASTNGTATDCDQVDLVSYDLTWSSGSSLNATGTFQYSHDKVNWVTIDFGSTITLSGASGEHRIDIEPNFKYVRPVITFAAGSANITITVKGTTRGA